MTRKESTIQFLRFRVEALEKKLKKNDKLFDKTLLKIYSKLSEFQEIDKRLINLNRKLRDENRKLKNKKR